MPRFVLHIDTPGGGRFLPWSTVVDAPIAYGMTEAEYREWCAFKYGRMGTMDLDAHIARAKESGCSMPGWSLGDAISCNRAGPDESEATLAEIRKQFCAPVLPDREPTP